MELKHFLCKYNGPAQVSISPNLKKILILNRTKATKRSTIDGILTGEMLNQDKNNVEECLNGLQQTLGGSSRFQVSRASEIMAGTAVKNFSAPISWNDIDLLCRKYNTDAVLSLEFFDTDFIVTNGKKSKIDKITGKDTVRSVVIWAKGVGQVKAGFRIYNPNNKSIAYENRFDVANNWEETAATLQEATAKLIQKETAVRNLSNLAGSDFARQVIPTFAWESREYYKGKDELNKKASRLAAANQWSEAITTWKSAINTNISAKEKGKTAFNIALGYEVLGDLDEAKHWTQEAYVTFRNKKALSYGRTIDQQIENRRILRQQHGQ